MADNIDSDAGTIRAASDIEDVGRRMRCVLAVANGERTCSELPGTRSLAITAGA